MSEHKYKVGSRVMLAKPLANARPGEYTIVRLLPVEGNEPQYRVKSDSEPTERVVKEFELRPRRG